MGQRLALSHRAYSIARVIQSRVAPYALPQMASEGSAMQRGGEVWPCPQLLAVWSQKDRAADGNANGARIGLIECVHGHRCVRIQGRNGLCPSQLGTVHEQSEPFTQQV